MQENSKDESKNQTKLELNTFAVPFHLNEIQDNININTNCISKLSKEKIVDQGLKFHLEGNIQKAIKYYQFFINQGFNDHRVFSNYGVILKGLGRLEQAELFYRKAVELKPDFAQAHSNLGNILKDLGNLKEAELFTRKAIEIKPDFAKAHSNLGNILKDFGKLKEAEISTRKAIEFKSDFPEAHLNLGNILRDLGKLKEAEIYTRKAIKLNPDFAQAHSNLGVILKEIGKIDEAKDSYSKAIKIQPGFEDALINRWQLFFDEGEFELALRDADSCNTKDSRVCALETLYALGRIDEIYERIEKISQLDDENIRLAAFSSFISAHEKKDTAHNFCNAPISFLRFANLKYHCQDYISFIDEIIKELRDVKTIWEPRTNTTRNGFHTPSHINLFLNSTKNILQLKSIISNEVDAYYLKFQKESCSYIQKWPSNKNFVAWHVILKKQGYQAAHIHPGGWLSGVIYLKVVPPLDKDEGSIEFSLNGENYSNVNSSHLIYQPKLGDIVLFPSSLYHRTIPFTTDTDRIVIAFDLMPKSFKSFLN